MSAKVKALKAGFYGGARRRPGSVFVLVDGDAPASWMEVVNVDVPVSKPKGKSGQTFSEITKQEAKALTPKGADDLV